MREEATVIALPVAGVLRTFCHQNQHCESIMEVNEILERIMKMIGTDCTYGDREQMNQVRDTRSPCAYFIPFGYLSDVYIEVVSFKIAFKCFFTRIQRTDVRKQFRFSFCSENILEVVS